MTTASGSAEEHTGDVSELLALVARQLDLRMPEIVREMRDLLASRIDDLGGDPQLVEMLQASIEGNVTTICHILANGIDLESLQPTTAAVEYAARLAQRDVPLAALTRAYYLGQSMFLRLGMDEAERLGVTDRVKIDVVRDIADVVHRYIDWILQLVTGVHEQERRRWWTTRATLNASIILKVLRGDSLPIRGFVSETGYTLAQTHLGVMAWSDVDAEDAARQHEIDHLLRRLATAVHSSAAPLITVVDRSTAWAWFGGARLDAEHWHGWRNSWRRCPACGPPSASRATTSRVFAERTSRPRSHGSWRCRRPATGTARWCRTPTPRSRWSSC